MKYCFKPIDGKYLDFDEQEFAGTNGTDTESPEPGFFDAIKSLLREEIRRLFMLGYEAGYQTASEHSDDVSERERIALEARHNAWKSYDSYCKENVI